jgi:hypothetical protein
LDTTDAEEIKQKRRRSSQKVSTITKRSKKGHPVQPTSLSESDEVKESDDELGDLSKLIVSKQNIFTLEGIVT